MTAKEKMLQLTSLVGIHKAREHFLSITKSGGTSQPTFMTIMGADMKDNTLSANLKSIVLSANLDTSRGDL